MADTNTTNLNLIKPEIGGAEDTWGVSINSDLDALDAIFSATGTEIDVRFNSANFDDNKKAIFGTGDDLQIYHDGSNSYIEDAGTGNLWFKSNGATIGFGNSDLSELFAVFNKDGASKLYFNNSSKIETTSTGVSVSGGTSSTLLIDASTHDSSTANTAILNFGFGHSGSPDAIGFIKLTENGTNSFNGTMTFGVPKNNGSGGSTTNTVLTIDEDGDTTFTGDVTLTGASADIVFDKSDNALEFATNAKAVFGSSLSISRIGNSSYIHETGSGDLYIKGSDIYITDQDNNQFIHLDDDGTGGTVRLKHEGSTKLSTTSTGVDVTGVLAVNSGTTDTAATFTSSDTAIAVNFVASDNSMQIATSGTDGIIKNNGAGSLRLFNNGSEAARINSSGLVGIGTTSPSSPLEIKSSATNNTGGLRIIQDSGTNLVASLFGGVNSGTRFGRLELSETSGDAINVRISADPSLSSYINSGNFGIGTTSPATP